MRRKATRKRAGFQLFGKKKDKAEPIVEMESEHEVESPLEHPMKKRKERRKKPKGSWKESAADFFKNKVVLGVLCIVFSILVVFVGGPALQTYQARRVPVVKVTENILKDSVITMDMLTLSEIGAVDLPEGAASSVDQVVGLYASVELLKDDIITVPKVKKTPQADDMYLYNLPEGKRAISVNVSGLAEGLSGKLRHGDIVSLYAAVHNSDIEEEYYALQPNELKYIKVLAVSNSYGVDIDEENRVLAESDRNTNLPATLTLLVNDTQAAALAGLDKNATLYAALVIRDDPEAGQLYLDAQDEYLAKLEEDEEREEDIQPQIAPPTEEGEEETEKLGEEVE